MTNVSVQLERIKSGIAAHDLRMCPVLLPEEVEEFERLYNVTLPVGYRRFLLEVGNGGAGPSFCEGLLPIGEDAYNLAQYYLPLLHKEFPFDKTELWEEGDKAREVVEEEIRRSHYGHLLIGDDGCAQFIYLVVTGPQRGQVWDISFYGALPLNRNFLDWYEDWLDSLGDYPD